MNAATQALCGGANLGLGRPIRRLARDYERLVKPLAADHWLALVSLMLNCSSLKVHDRH